MHSTQCAKCSAHTATNAKYIVPNAKYKLNQMLSTHCNKCTEHTEINAQNTQHPLLTSHWSICSVHTLTHYQ